MQNSNNKSNFRPREKFTMSRRQVQNRFMFWLLCTPAILAYTVFLIYPLLNMGRVSLLNWKSIVKPSTFIGLGNYSHMFSDERFWIAARNTSIQVLVILAVVIPLSFILGYFLNRRLPGHRIFRTIFFSPGMLSIAGLAMVFTGVYLPDGILNQFLRQVGLSAFTHVWLADTNTALAAVIAVEFWGGIGWYAVLFFSSLSNIPIELFEAAELDGAGHWTRMWRIAFPMILDFVGVMIMLEYMWVLLGSAQTILLLTRGGPGNASINLSYYLYTLAFDVRNLGYSQAIGVFIFIIGVIGMFLIRKITRRTY
jgi:multiple sugar transport system permease protein